MGSKQKKGKKPDDGYGQSTGRKTKGIKKPMSHKEQKSVPSHEDDHEEKSPLHNKSSSLINHLYQPEVAPLSQLDQLRELKNKFIEKKETRKKTLTDYQLHKKNYLKLQELLNEGKNQFQKTRDQLRKTEQKIFDQQLSKYRTLASNPFVFQKQDSFKEFYSHLCSLPHILDCCAYKNPCSSIQFTKIIPEAYLEEASSFLKPVVKSHLSKFPYITTTYANLDIILPLMELEGEYFKQNKGQKIKLINLPSLFMAETNFPHQLLCNVSLTAFYFFLSDSNYFCNCVVKVLQKNSEQNKDFFNDKDKIMFTRQLICKGLRGIKYIYYPIQDRQLRAFTNNLNIYINTYQIERKYQDEHYSSKLLQAYIVMVLIREIMNYVFQNIQYCFEKQKKQLKTIIEAQFNRTDIGVKMEHQLTNGKDFQCVSCKDLEIIQNGQLDRLSQLGQANQDMGNFICFQEYSNKLRQRTHEILRKSQKIGGNNPDSEGKGEEKKKSVNEDEDNSWQDALSIGMEEEHEN